VKASKLPKAEAFFCLSPCELRIAILELSFARLTSPPARTLPGENPNLPGARGRG